MMNDSWDEDEDDEDEDDSSDSPDTEEWQIITDITLTDDPLLFATTV